MKVKLLNALDCCVDQIEGHKTEVTDLIIRNWLPVLSEGDQIIVENDDD